MGIVLKEISTISPDSIKLTEKFLEETKKMIKFIVAYENKNPVACGALKHYDSETVEIKRMFVIKSFRRRGISKLILSELEKQSKYSGFKKIILETGIMQPAAISLYQKNNYRQINCYDGYANNSDSICFEKSL